MKKRILAWLLFHANRASKSPEFYAIKNRLLSRFGKPVGYDLQEIDGKYCFHCDGLGTCKYSDCDNCHWDGDCCRCESTGWWKLPQRNLLAKVQFGRYVFHQPISRLTEDEQPDVQIDARICGYIDHKASQFGTFALWTLSVLYRQEIGTTIIQDNLPF